MAALLLLASLALVVFIGTRQVVAWQRVRTARDAEAWYRRGTTAREGGRRDEAVVAFRRAHAKSMTSRSFTIALAHALAEAGQVDDAAGVLTTLREPSPEDPEINLELARLSAARSDVATAVRYYQSALYGVWPVGREDDRRAVRVELVRLLLKHGRRTDAVGELMALTSNLSDTSANHLEAGQMMLEAGEPLRAREQFQRALALDPQSVPAREGAGEGAFQLGDYVEARRFLQGLRAPSPRAADLRQLAEEVIARDPLAPRLRLAERRQRVMALVSQERGRIASCLERTRGLSSGATARLETAQRNLQVIDQQLRPRIPGDESETIESAVDALYRVEQAATDVCGDPSVTDKALVLIGRANEAKTQ